MLSDRAEKISGPVPVAHDVRAELGSLRPGVVAAECPVHRYVQVIEPRSASMISAQGGQHQLVPVSVEDAVKDDMIAMIQRIACYLVDQPDVRCARLVPFPQDDPPDEILRDPGHTKAVGVAQRPGDGALARTGVAAKNDEPRLIGPDSHAADPRYMCARRLSRHGRSMS